MILNNYMNSFAIISANSDYTQKCIGYSEKQYGFFNISFFFSKTLKENQENNNFFLKSYEFEIRPRRHYLGYSLVAISCGMGLYPKSDLRNFGELHLKKIIKYGKK